MADYCKVVIIDDEFLMRQGIKHMLDWEKEGFQIVGEASNGKEGLDVIEKTNPHIVLCDIVMPILDGIDFSEILKERFPQIELIILSGYDKFEYVKAALLNGASDYILKPTINPQNLLEVLRRTAERIPGLELSKEQKSSPVNQMTRYLEGYQEALNEVAWKEYFPNTLYRLWGVNLKKLCENQKEKMLFVQNSISKYFEGKKEYVNHQVLIGEEILCCIFNYRIKEERIVVSDIEKCVEKISMAYPKAFFIVGHSFMNMHEIRKWYQEEIKDMVNQQFYHKGQKLLLVEDYQHAEGAEERFPFSEFAIDLNNKRFQEAFQMLEGYMVYLCGRKVDEDKVKNQIKNLLYNYLSEIEKYDEESEKLKQIYFRKIDKTIYKEDLLELFQEIKSELGKILVDRVNVENVKIMEIKRYIQEHYKEPLDLKEIAEIYNYNYNYLSSYFSRQTKEGFSEYLNKIRIEQACELLKHGEKTISEISTMIGYSDHSYFCRVFKKMTGETPSNYKRKLKME